MSLFTVREWWAVSPDGTSDADYGASCLAIGNFDNAADGHVKVATGSFSGLLRLYNPREPGYQVEDLMVEQVLEAPILQLAVGQFLSDSNRLALAVLHPHCIAVHSLSAMTATGGGALDEKSTSYFKLTKAYEHSFERPTCNFVHGTFGGAYGHDHILVQTMDGILYAHFSSVHPKFLLSQKDCTQHYTGT